MNTPIPVECAKPKKCGWKGFESEMIYIETKRDIQSMERNGIRSRTGSCPKCGNTEFYYPDMKKATQ